MFLVEKGRAGRGGRRKSTARGTAQADNNLCGFSPSPKFIPVQFSVGKLITMCQEELMYICRVEWLGQHCLPCSHPGLIRVCRPQPFHSGLISVICRGGLFSFLAFFHSLSCPPPPKQEKKDPCLGCAFTALSCWRVHGVRGAASRSLQPCC